METGRRFSWVVYEGMCRLIFLVSESNSGVVREIEEEFLFQSVFGRKESCSRGWFGEVEGAVRERKFCVLSWFFVL